MRPAIQKLTAHICCLSTMLLANEGNFEFVVVLSPCKVHGASQCSFSVCHSYRKAGEQALLRVLSESSLCGMVRSGITHG